jgi:hypothetical protein
VNCTNYTIIYFAVSPSLLLFTSSQTQIFSSAVFLRHFHHTLFLMSDIVFHICLKPQTKFQFCIFWVFTFSDIVQEDRFFWNEKNISRKLRYSFWIRYFQICISDWFSPFIQHILHTYIWRRLQSCIQSPVMISLSDTGKRYTLFRLCFVKCSVYSTVLPVTIENIKRLQQTRSQ